MLPNGFERPACIDEALLLDFFEFRAVHAAKRTNFRRFVAFVNIPAHFANPFFHCFCLLLIFFVECRMRKTFSAVATLHRFVGVDVITNAFETIFAHAVKHDFRRADLAAIALAVAIGKTAGAIDVANTSATCAYKMSVWLRTRIKSLCRARHSQLFGAPQETKLFQIAINGAQTDVGHGFAHLFVDPLHVRMSGCGAQNTIHRFSLFRISQRLSPCF